MSPPWSCPRPLTPCLSFPRCYRGERSPARGVSPRRARTSLPEVLKGNGVPRPGDPRCQARTCAACTYGCECERVCEQGEAGNREWRRPHSAGQGPGGGGWRCGRLGPTSHVKQLCAGAAVPGPAACGGGGSRGGQKERPLLSFSPQPGPVPAGDVCPAGTCGCWGTDLPCSAPPVPPSLEGVGVGIAQCPFWAQLHATVRHGDGSVPPLGTGTAQYPHRAWGQFSVPIGHSSVSPSGMGMAQCPHQA